MSYMCTNIKCGNTKPSTKSGTCSVCGKEYNKVGFIEGGKISKQKRKFREKNPNEVTKPKPIAEYDKEIILIRNQETGNPILGVGFDEKMPNRFGGTKTKRLIGFMELGDTEISITKQTVIRKKDRGVKHIGYNQITSVDYDKGKLFGKPAIQIYLSSREYTFLSGDSSEYVKVFYNELRDRLSKFNAKPGSVNLSGESNLDELKKLAELRDLGIVTEKEFELKKKQLLGL